MGLFTEVSIGELEAAGTVTVIVGGVERSARRVPVGRVDDALLDALADRWPFIPREYPGQTFEAWLCNQLRYYNEYGYPRNELDSSSLWDMVDRYPAATYADYVECKATEMRAEGGTFAKAARGLSVLASLALRLSN